MGEREDMLSIMNEAKWQGVERIFFDKFYSIISFAVELDATESHQIVVHAQHALQTALKIKEEG